MKLIFVSEGLRMFKRKLRVESKGFNKYADSVKNICHKIIIDCYDSKNDYFKTSNGHFSEYWGRDFGLCVRALKNLGFQKEIENTLSYALNIFEKNKTLTTTISPNYKPFNFPNYAPDTLAFTLHSLITTNNKKLISKYKSFLESEARKYFEIVINKKTGLVKNKHFSSMKDHAIRVSSCYDNVMSAWISKNLNTLNFNNPLKDYNFKRIIKDNFWNGDYFIDDLSGGKLLTGDANVFPFWTGIFNSKKMLKSAIKSLQNKNLDKPFPLKYSLEKPKVVWYDLFAKDYEFRNIWPIIGYPFIEIVSKLDIKQAKLYLNQYSEQIIKHKTFLEVYDFNGKPFKTFFYYSDEAMLWASMHLNLLKELNS